MNQKIKKYLLYYEASMKQLKTYLDILNDELNFLNSDNPISHISTRIKSKDSIIEKIKRKKLPLNLKGLSLINDIVGARIVCDFIDNVYLVASKITENQSIKVVEVKDYIKNPKKSGYRGIHIIVEIPVSIDGKLKNIRAEIQIRTLAMDSWASNEHKLNYKKCPLSEEVIEDLKMSADKVWQVELSMNKIYKMKNEQMINVDNRLQVFNWKVQNEL